MGFKYEESKEAFPLAPADENRGKVHDPYAGKLVHGMHLLVFIINQALHMDGRYGCIFLSETADKIVVQIAGSTLVFETTREFIHGVNGELLPITQLHDLQRETVVDGNRTLMFLRRHGDKHD